MGRRMYVAIVPPEHVREDLGEFLAVRGGLAWTPPDRLHVTLAFLADVPERVAEPLLERLGDAARPVEPFTCALAGAGAFPHPDRPAVLWMGVAEGEDALARLALRVRSAANAAGAPPDGRSFVPHVTLARPPRGRSAVRWLRVLDAYRSRPWTVDELVVVDSQLLGRGRRPLHEVVARIPLGAG